MKIDPRGMSFIAWADKVVEATRYDLPRAHRVGWQLWAAEVLEVPAIAAQQPPRPEGYPDWRMWAEDFNRTVEL